MQFNETLALLRKSRGFTQEQLAEQLGVSRQAIARWESGETAPDVYILRDLSEIFGISADGLLNGVDEIPPSAAVKDSPVPQTVSEDAAPPEPPAKTAASVRSKLIFAAAVIAIAAVTVTANVGIIKFSGMNSTGAKNIYSPIGADNSGLTSLSNAAKTEFWTAEEYEKWAEEQLGIYRKKFESGEKILWHKGGGETSSALTEDDMKNIENALSKTLSAIKDGDLFTKDESFSWTDDSGKIYSIKNGEAFATAASDEITVCESYDDSRTFGGSESAAETADEVSVAQGSAETSGQTFEEIFAKYTKFGLKYVESDGKRRLYYNGKSVGKFVDEDPGGGVFVFTPDGGSALTVRAEYDSEGNLTGVGED